MNYFSNIDFVTYGMREGSHTFHRKVCFPYWGLQFVWRGEISLQIDNGKIFTASTPAVFITSPGATFSYGSLPGRQRNHIFCCFKGKRLEEYVASGLLPERMENPLIPISDYKFFLEKFRLLLRELRIPGEYHHARSVLLLEELLLTLQEENSHASLRGKTHFPALRSLQEKVAAAPEKKWDFEEEAKNLSLSYSQFRFLYKQMTGQPPWKYLLECRLRKGEELLLASSLRINEVAHLCGFEDEFHFSRSFRQNRGFSPSRYRANYGEGEGEN